MNADMISSKYRFAPTILQEIRILYHYSHIRGVVALMWCYSLIGFAIFVAEYQPYFIPLAIILIGSRQRALATILHEASHGTLMGSKKLNKILGTYFSGYLIFQTWGSYKISHVLNHHYKLGDPDHDPDFKYYLRAGVYEEKKQAEFVKKFLITPLLFLNIFSNIRYLVTNRLMHSAGKAEYIKMLLTISIFAAIGSIIIGPKFIFLYWVLPYLTVFQALTWFIELAEHYPMIGNAQDNLHAARNRFSHPVEQFLTGMYGENFHLIHHLFPGIPFWNLKKAHLILLQDSEYAKLNASFGGIFFSSNFSQSLWQSIISRNKHLSRNPAGE